VFSGVPIAIDRDVVDLDSSLGQQLFDVAIGQPVSEVPADRHGDHLTGGNGSRPARKSLT
jgi:hypothetical protein